MGKALKEKYPLLHKRKLLRRVGEAATAPLQIYGTYEDQKYFHALMTPGLLLELLDYWFSNDGKKLDYRSKTK